MKGLTHVLDTSVYSQRLRPHPNTRVVRRWRQAGDASLAISSICEAELLYGLEKRNSSRLWNEYHASLENALILLPVDLTVSRIFARMKTHMEQQGMPRADFDLLIAATAVAHDLTLATGNVRHFKDIPNLRVEDWFS